MAKETEQEHGPEQESARQRSVREQLEEDLQRRGQAPTERAAHRETPEELATPLPLWKRPVSGVLGLVKRMDVLMFCRELAMLIECGVPLLRALRILQVRTSNLTLGRVAGEMADAVAEGQALSTAAARHPRIFTKAMISMMEAGERSGRLVSVLERIADRGEEALTARRRAIGILAYPVLVFALALVVIGVVFGVLADGFSRFEEMGVDMPASMRFLLGVGEVLRSPAFWTTAILIIAGVVVAYILAMKTLPFRLLRDRFLLRCPGVQHFVKQELLISFSRLFSLLLHSGVRLKDSLQATREASRNEVLRLTLERAESAVDRGEQMTETLRDANVFPPLANDLFTVGEEAGALARILDKTGDVYDVKQGSETQLLAKLVQPVIIILLALIVGFILFSFFSMYLAAFEAASVSF